jgi:SPP1 gp7 family putative phage head morphogenesis protein
MLQSRSISHAHYLERYKTQVVKRILEILKPSERNIVERLQTVDPDTFTEARLRRLLEDVRTISAEAVAELNIGLSDELKEFGAYESEWQAQQIQTAVPIEINITQPSPDQIFAAIQSRPFAGMLLADQVTQYGERRVALIEQAVRQGWIEGETIQSIARRVRGSRASNYTDGIISTTRKHAESLVRTAVNHTHTVARQSLYDNNRDLVKGVQYVATLDNRTTMICASLDGSIHPIDSGPRPPQHFGCRSTTVPVVKS